MKTLRTFTQISLTLVILYLGLRFVAFKIIAADNGSLAPLVNQADYLKNRNNYVGKHIHLEGLPLQNYYLLGLGVYRLTDSKGNVVTIISDQYPPDGSKIIEVTTFVQPLFKLNDYPTTILLQVKVPKTILSLHPKNN